jgi:hypothetical protein
MTLQSVLATLVGWIEDHATTIDLMKSVVVGLIAWALDVFRFLRAKLRRPKLEIETFTSRAIWQELGVAPATTAPLSSSVGPSGPSGAVPKPSSSP